MRAQFAQKLFAVLALFGIIATSACIAPVPPTTASLSGAYKVDPTHVSVTFKVSHFGLSQYTGRFARVDARADYDPAMPEKSRVEANIDAASIRTDYPYPEKSDFDKDLAGPDWFNASKYPTINFRSTAIEVTGTNTARITGDLTMLGVTRSIVLDAKMNAALKTHPLTFAPAFGISATAVVDRTLFGLSAWAPNVGVDVTILIEAEFLKN